ncbi:MULTISPECIES: tRNA adenosine(34) deaminase TadA [unclassified Polaromonas]|jgi:tRNA(adenine34) deaminase|uniref:tRNA adenosine(34) deaminase TadA n=1 Tax=unclassified Polaromonas TaxID=2638319 RepID=UPI0025E19CDC|nr:MULTISPECIES: tRNA adenosine(34) deaminase TadA [unclassified Polaromonas]HQR97157.1 tRNA adenosine(34) deaminase TadA [Polaromonas sp.]HQS41198.1 tRNA adenosine(34) deaminase TadA [Polaromonas sp.]HQS85245.1 tRNA adenosine(34) deaminase TadA [Polaromonas sp.]HQT06135.1 tRNA adenosine(34) deaminase TadA [Polaromonas sp.]
MSDADYMQLALAQARQAAEAGEVPVGAVLVRHGQVIATGCNKPINGHDPTAHAEMQALRSAAQAGGNYRLDECELFVTLEPCAMCAGAMLHARLKRVVFGAPDPKTGAAGSVIDLFAHPQLNHQTQVQGGVLAGECGAMLQDFFQQRRSEQRQETKLNHPLRDDALRTPDSAFAGLPDYPWTPRYLSDLPSLAGLRMHYLDEGPREGLTWLCLHGNPAWSYLYRKMIPVFLAAGHRVVAPDLIGFGKSDKPKKDSFHSFTGHRQNLLELVERLDLKNIVLVVQDWGGLLGLTLPMAAPERYRGLLVMNTTLATGDVPLSPGFLAWREMCAKNPEFDVARLFARGNPQMRAEECAAYNAPFPDRGHRAALRAFPAMVPEAEKSDGAAISREARSFWRERWQGRTLMAVGAQDPVLGLPVMLQLQAMIRGCPEPLVLPQAGHFVQEHGESIARQAVRSLGG